MLLETTFFRHLLNTKVVAYHLKYDADGLDELFSQMWFEEEGVASLFHLPSATA